MTGLSFGIILVLSTWTNNLKTPERKENCFVKKLNDKNFSEEVLRFHGVSIVEFTTSSCVPCKQMKATLSKLARSYNGETKFAEIDVFENQKIASRYMIQSVPTTVFFKKGRPANQINNVSTEYNIRKAIDQLL